MRAYTIHFVYTCITKLVLASDQCAGVLLYTYLTEAVLAFFSQRWCRHPAVVYRLVVESLMKEHYMEELFSVNCRRVGHSVVQRDLDNNIVWFRSR